MTTRAALLRLLFSMLLGTVLVAGALSFYEFRQALQSEIADNLRFGAGTVMQRIDTFLFSHVENMRVWRGLEVMQDIRVNDIDKRLSHFLSDLRAGQGNVYSALLCVNDHGVIVAASDPRLIGQPAPTAASWMPIPGARLGSVSMTPMAGRWGQPAILRTPIPNRFGSGAIGYLYMLLDWRSIEALLDDAVNNGPRSVMLLDRNQHVIAASRGLRQRGDVQRMNLSHWPLPRVGTASSIQSGKALGLGQVFAGAAASSGYQQFRGLGWSIVMLEPTAVSFRPIWRLLWAMVVVLLLVLTVSVWISSRLASRISRSLVALTDLARHFRQGDSQLPVVPATSILEVDELHRAYVEMIEALEQSREHVMRAGKLAVVGEMAAVMAHEVRTPLGILRSSGQLLQRQPGLGEKERELIGFILSETERLNRLVTMLLECARPTPPHFRLHDLGAIIDSAVGLLESRAEQHGVRLICDVATTEFNFECDREQMMQVLLNLILNALSFVTSGGRIVVGGYRDASALWISVADDGPGIAPELRQRVFDPFFTQREGGIGLGLTIVQQIVEAHGGQISVGESSWGGAAFSLRFSTALTGDEA